MRRDRGADSRVASFRCRGAGIRMITQQSEWTEFRVARRVIPHSCAPRQASHSASRSIRCDGDRFVPSKARRFLVLEGAEHAADRKRGH
jgi:hypothetical protein